MVWQYVRSSLVCLLATSGAIAPALIGQFASFISLGGPAQAQLVPDASLGIEGSLIVPDVLIDGNLADRIDGGAIRANNLFHSFLEFNVNDDQRVYFSNPVAIETIFSRVTGSNGTEILGTLGVLGNADLYLINPNGILFGADAQLDVRGSFVGSTTDSLGVDGGYIFSTLNPSAPPLLLVNFNPGLDAWLPTTGALVNRGNLSVGKDLTLMANHLTVEGLLDADRDLVLHATDSLVLRDSATTPLIVTAGNNLTLQGNQSLEITALDWPSSGLFSRSDTLLRSDQPIVVDTHFTAGGDFRAEQLDSSLGSTISLEDPVFEVLGNFELADFTGASLQVLAGGSVNIPGAVTINATGGIFNDSDVVLSNGTVLPIRGTTEQTVDIRAGTEGFFGTPGVGADVVTTADITVGSIITAGGLVFLTNQFQPNPGLPNNASANISIGPITTANLSDGGAVVIDSRGAITPNGIDVSGNDNGGDVTLLADGDITVPFGTAIISFGSVGGNINLTSNSEITQQGASNIEVNTMGVGTGGDITLMAPIIFLEGNVQNNLFPGGQGKTGNITVVAPNSLTTSQATLATATFADGDSGDIFIDTDSLNLDFTFLGTVTGSPTGGNAGNITVETDTLVGNNGGQIVSLAADLFGFGGVRGNTGNVNVTATDSISVTGIGPDDFTISGFGSSVLPGAMGDGGSITLQTGSLTIAEGAQVRASTQGEGNAGRIEINASDSITIDGAVLSALGPNPSGILSEVLPGAMGQGNEIVISTGNLSVSNGGFISASTNANGAAGNVTITATNAASFSGAPGEPFDPSGAFVGTLEDAAGDGGTLTITTPSLSVINGAQLEAETRGIGNAGNINLNVSDTVLVDGTDSAIQANTTEGPTTTEDSTGTGGDVTIDSRTRLVIVQNGGRIAVDSQGTGTGGNIEVTATELRLDQGEITAGADSNDGGDITLNLGPLLVLRNGSNISATAGRDQRLGTGGNVSITTIDGFVVAVDTENSDITANAFLGNGGNVTVNTQGLFGIEFRPALTPLSDITASSEFGLQGSVIIETPDVDPSDDLVQLPTGLVDASRLVAQGCGAGASDIATTLGEFTITGRGGLPSSPEQINSQNDLAVWETLDDMSNAPTAAIVESSTASTVTPQEPIQITEFQGWIVDDNGEIVLTAEASAVTPHNPWQSVFTCQTQG